MSLYNKYIKYKNKYIQLKNKLIKGGASLSAINKFKLRGCYSEIPHTIHKKPTKVCENAKCTPNLLLRLNNSIQNKGINSNQEHNEIFLDQQYILKLLVKLGLVELLHIFMEIYEFKINDEITAVTQTTLLQYAVVNCKCLKLFQYLIEEGADPLKTFQLGRNSAKVTFINALAKTTPKWDFLKNNRHAISELFNKNISIEEEKIDINIIDNMF